MTLRELRKTRSQLRRKLKEKRARHLPTDRVIAQLQSVTTDLLRKELSRQSAPAKESKVAA